MTVAARLDGTSRNTIGRFGLKLVFAFIFAALSRQDFCVGTSLWLSLYAVSTCAIGLLTRDRLLRYSFGHWDEALWLAAGAALFKVLSQLA